VERLHLAGAANHEQPDDGLRFGFRRSVSNRSLPAGDAVFEQHRPQREPSESHTDVGEKRAAGRSQRSVEPVEHYVPPGGHGRTSCGGAISYLKIITMWFTGSTSNTTASGLSMYRCANG